MYDTIDECEIRLQAIKAEIAKLTLEQNFLYGMMQIMGDSEANGVPTVRGATSEDIRQIITENPGLSSSAVLAKLHQSGMGLSARRLSERLATLRQRGDIENRGTTRHGGARWYIAGEES